MKSLQNVIVDASTSRKAKKIYHILKKFGQRFADEATDQRLSGGATGNRFFFLAYNEADKTWGYVTETVKIADVIQPIILRNRLAKELLAEGAAIIVQLNEDPSIEVLVIVKYVGSPKDVAYPVRDHDDLTIGIYEEGQFILSPKPQRASIGNTVRVSEFCRFAGIQDILSEVKYKALTSTTDLPDALSFALNSVNFFRTLKRKYWKTEPLSQTNRPFFDSDLGGTTAGKIAIDETKKLDDLLTDLRKSFDEFIKENGTGTVDHPGKVSRKHFFNFKDNTPDKPRWPETIVGSSDGLESILKKFPLPPFSKLWEKEIMNKPTAGASPWPEIGSLCAFWNGTYDEKTNKSVGILTNVDGFPFNTRYTCNHNSTYENARNVTPELAKQFIIK